MKKILATIVTLALVLSLVGSLAEQAPAINWADAESAAADIEGSWYTFETLALQMWVPDIFENADITEDDDPTMIAKFLVPDGSAAIYGQYVKGYEGATMENAIASIEANGGQEIERCTLNGLDAVSYSYPDMDAVYVTFVTESGNFVQFIFTPVSDEGFKAVAQLVTASIMPEE